jgi:hypothetical protein
MARAQRGVRWWLWPYRIIVTLVAFLAYLQSILAGQFLSGTYGSLLAHQNTAAVIDMLLIAAIVVGLVITMWGRRSWWPVVVPLGLLGLTSLQNQLGFARQLTVHIPLGVTIVMAATVVAIWAWRLPAAPGRTAAATTTQSEAVR